MTTQQILLKFKKFCGEKTFLDTLTILKKENKRDPKKIMVTTLRRLRPALKIISQIRAGKVIYLPSHLSENNAYLYALKWLVSASREFNRKLKLAKKLSIEISLIQSGRGLAIKQLTDMNKAILSSRTNLFKPFKRITYAKKIYFNNKFKRTVLKSNVHQSAKICLKIKKQTSKLGKKIKSTFLKKSKLYKKKIKMKSLRIIHLCFGLRQKGGRSRGVITAPRRGSLIKKTYRFLDTKRTLFTGKGALIINQYIYDPNRSGMISLIVYPNGILTYILAPKFPKTQTRISNLIIPKNSKDKGYSSYLCNLSSGALIYNLKYFCRSAGVNGILLKNKNRDSKAQNFIVKLKSGEHRLFSETLSASVGCVSNQSHSLRIFKHAGRIRRYGIRPRVRPSAMNPVDHPMAGRTRGGCAPQSHTGKLSLGTSPLPKKNHHLIIVTARKSRYHRIS